LTAKHLGGKGGGGGAGGPGSGGGGEWAGKGVGGPEEISVDGRPSLPDEMPLVANADDYSELDIQRLLEKTVDGGTLSKGALADVKRGVAPSAAGSPSAAPTSESGAAGAGASSKAAAAKAGAAAAGDSGSGLSATEELAQIEEQGAKRGDKFKVRVEDRRADLLEAETGKHVFRKAKRKADDDGKSDQAGEPSKKKLKSTAMLTFAEVDEPVD
jgi:hypothetical protein